MRSVGLKEGGSLLHMAITVAASIASLWCPSCMATHHKKLRFIKCGFQFFTLGRVVGLQDMCTL